MVLYRDITLCATGVHGEVRIPSEDGEDLEKDLEETLVRPQRWRTAVLQVTRQFDLLNYNTLLDWPFSITCLTNLCDGFSQSDVIRRPQGQVEVNGTSSIARGDGKQVLQVLVCVC